MGNSVSLLVRVVGLSMRVSGGAVEGGSFFTEELAMGTKATDVNSIVSRGWICSSSMEIRIPDPVGYVPYK